MLIILIELSKRFILSISIIEFSCKPVKLYDIVNKRELSNFFSKLKNFIVKRPKPNVEKTSKLKYRMKIIVLIINLNTSNNSINEY